MMWSHNPEIHLESAFGKVIEIEESEIMAYPMLFSRSYECEVTIPQKSLLHIRVWDWDSASLNDKRRGKCRHTESLFFLASHNLWSFQTMRQFRCSSPASIFSDLSRV